MPLWAKGGLTLTVILTLTLNRRIRPMGVGASPGRRPDHLSFCALQSSSGLIWAMRIWTSVWGPGVRGFCSCMGIGYRWGGRLSGAGALGCAGLPPLYLPVCRNICRYVCRNAMLSCCSPMELAIILQSPSWPNEKWASPPLCTRRVGSNQHRGGGGWSTSPLHAVLK